LVEGSKNWGEGNRNRGEGIEMGARELKTGAREIRKRSKGRAVLPNYHQWDGSTSKATMKPTLSRYQFTAEVKKYFVNSCRVPAITNTFEYVNYEHFL
jgi:hypothetical protein